MITVMQERDNVYTVQLDVPELVLLHKLAIGLSIPQREVLVSCINKGLEYYTAMLQEIAEHEARKLHTRLNEG